MKWFQYSLLAAFFLALVALTAKYVLNKGVKVPVLLFYALFSGTIIAAAYLFFTKQPLKLEALPLAVIIALIAFSLIGNYFYFTAVSVAPNPGYVTAVLGMETGIVALASILLFKSEITPIKGFGMLLAVLGIALLAWKS